MSSQSQIDKKTIQKIASLAQLALTAKEEDLYTTQLGQILNYVSQLSEVNTENIEPMVTATEMLVTFREDEVKKMLTPDEVLSNAPERSGHLFKVPPVL
ncbi:MAG: Asp-tRNA(Asn)/Glu-tRNA(Gln) amidotransferase subunit GatC [Oligoflexia bacterium]|nr:Asp-tRNA(Asn)/Glu-tRNA(Gln) amidotransferase subunit GatC [Oligoflexia bacterium]